MTNQIFNTDCLIGMRDIPAGSIDCVITDPPYNLGLFSKSRSYHVSSMRTNSFVSDKWDNDTGENWHNLMQSLFELLADKVKISGNLVQNQSYSAKYELAFRFFQRSLDSFRESKKNGNIQQ